MKRAYISATMQVVSMDNCDIVTTSIAVGTKSVDNPGDIQAPGRRRSIWD